MRSPQQRRRQRHAWVRGTAVVQDFARVRDWAIVDSGTISGNARVLEHATVGGNMQDTAVAKGSALHQKRRHAQRQRHRRWRLHGSTKSLSNGITFGHLPFRRHPG
jgi:hypothetical protein